MNLLTSIDEELLEGKDQARFMHILVMVANASTGEI